jgi:hypothetical protein
MKYGKLYKALIIAAGICFISFALKRLYKPPRVEQENMYHETVELNRGIKHEGSNSGLRETDEEPGNAEETKIVAEYPDIAETLPDESVCPENFSPYDDDIHIDCYFTNTENTIDVNGILPLYAQEILSDAAQIWFDQNGLTAGEIRCLEGSVQKTENEISFKAESADMIILFTYNLESRTWHVERGSI